MTRFNEGDTVTILVGVHQGQTGTVLDFDNLDSLPVIVQVDPQHFGKYLPTEVRPVSGNRETALQIAFNNFVSNAEDLDESVSEIMKFSDEDWNENVSHWQPFEEWDSGETRRAILDLADAIEDALNHVTGG